MSVIDSALVQIRQLHPYSPGKPVEELERELGIRDAIKLASNENPLGCSPRVSEVLGQASQHIELYPDANAYYLKQRLAHKIAVDENQITIGNGSNDVLDLVARSFLDSSAEAVFSQYAFMVYAMVTQACGATARVADALPETASQPYGHDLDAMLVLIGDKTRVVFIANPNNPTGNWLLRDELEHFLDAVPDHIAVVIDEAYFTGLPACASATRYRAPNSVTCSIGSGNRSTAIRWRWPRRELRSTTKPLSSGAGSVISRACNGCRTGSLNVKFTTFRRPAIF